MGFSEFDIMVSIGAFFLFGKGMYLSGIIVFIIGVAISPLLDMYGKCEWERMKAKRDIKKIRIKKHL